MTDEYRYGTNWKRVDGVPELVESEWWLSFRDDELNKLMSELEIGNPDLESALARVRQAEARARLSASYLSPQIQGLASISREGLSAGRTVGADLPVTTEQYVLGLSFEYEFDIWGRARNASKADAWRAEGERASLDAIRLGLFAAVVTNYLELRGTDEQIDLLERTIAAYQNALALVQIRQEGGLASGLDLSRAEAQLAATSAVLPRLRGERSVLENRIAILTGQVPALFQIAPADGMPQLPNVSHGIPSDLLRQRPDIARAEAEIRAANAQVGVAQAAMFPRFSFGVQGGYQAASGSMFSAPNSYWAIGPFAIEVPVLDGGQRAAGLQISLAEYEQASARYRSSVLSAFEEVESVLAYTSALERQEEEWSKASVAARRTESLSFERYQDGASGYLDVLLAQTAAFEAERSLILVQTARRKAAVTLIKAVGGPIAHQKNTTLN